MSITRRFLSISLSISLSLCWGLLGLLLAVISPTVARAAGPATAASAAGGSALLARAIKALAKPDLDAAQKLFTDAYLEDPQPAILCWLGRVAQRRGGSPADAVRSLDYFRRCVSAGRPPADATLWQEAQAAAASAPPQVELQIIDHEAGFLWLDEVLLGQAPLDRPVLTTAGPHVLKRVRGSHTQQQEIRLSRDQPVYLTWLSSGGWDTAFMDMFLVLLPAAGAGSSGPLFPAIEAALEKNNAIAVASQRVQPAAGSASSSAAAAAAGCRGDTACLIQRAKSAQVPFALEIVVDNKSTYPPGAAIIGKYNIEIYAIDARVEERIYQQSQTCDGCSPQALQSKLVDAALAARRQALRGVGSLAVESQPSAQLSVDGRPRGKTPLQLVLYSGSHTLSLAHPSSYPLSQTVEISEGKLARTRLALKPLPLTRGEKALRIGKWVLGVAGLAQLAVAIPLLLLPEPTVPDSNPLLRVQTHDIGGVALGTGAACLTAGVVLFAVDAARSDRRHAPW